MSKEEKRKRVAIYCRVSTTEQAEEGYSIGEQERLIREYCTKQDYEVYKVFSDAGISGKDIVHRPAIQELLKDATEKKFDMVMSWKINRLSRKLEDAIKIVNTLDRYGISYQSYSERFESDTPAGKMQFQMMALVGEFERNTIAQNVKMGMKAKARAGEWCGGAAPLGYHWVPLEGTENAARKKSRLEIEETEAEAVRLIYDLYASGKGYKAIVNHINKLGYKSKKGNAFSVAQLRTILTNPVYIGKVRYDVRRNWNEKRRSNINPEPIIADGIHQAIIEEEQWNQVQFLISQKSGKPSRIYDGEYPLTGILKCPECGAGMVISRVCNKKVDGSKRKLTYYACGNWKNKGTAVCHSNMIRVEKANSVVYQRMEEILNDDKVFNEVYSRVNREHNILKKNACMEQTLQEKERQKLENRMSRNHEAYEDGLITKEEFLTRKNQLEQQMEQVRERTNESRLILLEEERREIPKEAVRAILQNFSLALSGDIDHTIRKRLLHLLIKEITVDRDRNIDSIKIKLSDDLIRFLQNNGGTPPDGAPSVFMFREFGMKSLELEFVI
ncbi:recombinase family protein [Clostridiaceae bacterium]|nr:recombinase family protein [Clostridiaceae bacterium]